ncbi:MAG: class II fumarate hydratase [Rickettsiaceae bacterium]
MQDQFRIEVDALGEIKVPKTAYWGAQTQRSLENFKIGSEKMPKDLIYAYVLLKKVAAKCNHQLSILNQDITDSICDAADQVLSGKFDDQFLLSVWQTGSGTQTNMNINEVLASIANEKLTGDRGGKHPIHPNDHVNCSQSSNDSFPTAMHVATAVVLNRDLLPMLKSFKDELYSKARIWDDIVKIGRTHLQDATPLTLGQEFSSYAAQIQHATDSIEFALSKVYYLAQGGTAVGTGINCPNGFGELFASLIANITTYPFKTATNKFESLSSHGALVDLSGALNHLATSLNKIVNDIRLLASGPRCGFGELILPSNEPGSSIMPGKVNPTQCEALAMICSQVIGNNVAITFGGSNGHLELNVYKPLIIYNILQSIELLSTGMKSFLDNCLKNIQPNIARIKELKDKSLMLVTALNPHIGYDNAAKIAKKAYKDGTTLKEAAISLELLSPEEFDRLVVADFMVGK